MDPDLECMVAVERMEGDGAESRADMVEEAVVGRPDTDGDEAELDAAAEEGLAKADMSTRARPVPGVGREAVGVVLLDKEGDE